MAGRDRPLITDEIYHVINRGVAHQPIFQNDRDYRRAIETIFYYQNRKPPLRYSFLIRLPEEEKTKILEGLKKKRDFSVDIIAYCLMPNHIHLLLKQICDGGISSFMSNVSNSYARYFNVKQKRVGPIFQSRFKYVRVETDEQLWHLSRYIHLNPYSAYLVKRPEQTKNYKYSSLAEYLNGDGFCNKKLILDNFNGKFRYSDFVFDQADCQRRLQDIKHLVIEKDM